MDHNLDLISSIVLICLRALNSQSMLRPFGLSAQHMPVIVFILTNACYFSSGDRITRACWTLISPTPQEKGNHWGKTSSLKGEWQRLALSTFFRSLCVCTHKWTITYWEKEHVERDSTLSGFFHGVRHRAVFLGTSSARTTQKGRPVLKGALQSLLPTEWSCALLQIELQYSGYPHS